MMPQYGKPAISKELGRVFPTVDCSKDEPLTVQAQADEVDINRIVARIEKGLSVPMLGNEPFYGDVSDWSGLQDALIKVRESEELFMSYPASLRAKFDNNPVKFVEFLENKENHDEAVKLGLAIARPKDERPAEPAPAPAEPKKPE